MNKINCSSLTNWFSCLDCCYNTSETGQAELERSSLPNADKESPKTSLCIIKDSLSHSISGTVLIFSAGWRNKALKENAPKCKRAFTCILSSTVAFFTVPLAVIEGVARRAIGWTLSLLNRILPCGNEMLVSLNNTSFKESIRVHTLITFSAFEYMFGIFEPKTLLRAPEEIKNNSIIFNILSRRT
jgi:hypothetical protein